MKTFLLDIAAELEHANHSLMADRLDGDLLEAFDAAMRTECLVVIDDLLKYQTVRRSSRHPNFIT